MGPSSIPIHLAFGIEGYVSSSRRKIGNIFDTPDRRRLKRFVDEHSYLICTHEKVKDKYVLRYYVPKWMDDFFFDPNRSLHLYSISLVIKECRKAIQSLILDLTPDFYNDGLVYFFMQTLTPSGEIPIDNMANATRLLESARNRSDRKELLLFLEYLSEIHWFDIYLNGGWVQRHFTNRLVHWVCTTLVG